MLFSWLCCHIGIYSHVGVKILWDHFKEVQADEDLISNVKIRSTVFVSIGFIGKSIRFNIQFYAVLICREIKFKGIMID